MDMDIITTTLKYTLEVLVVIIAFVYYGLPILQTMMAK